MPRIMKLPELQPSAETRQHQSQAKRNGRTSQNHGLACASASSSQTRTPRLRKTSQFVGVRSRGCRGYSIEFRRPDIRSQRVSAGNFTSEEEAAMAQDLARALFTDEVGYLALDKSELNFWENRAALFLFFNENGREEIVGKVWTKIEKKKLKDVASEALKKKLNEVDSEAVREMQKKFIDSGLQSGNLPPHFEHSRNSRRNIPQHIPEVDAGVSHVDASMPIVCTSADVMENQGSDTLAVDENGSMIFLDNNNTADTESTHPCVRNIQAVDPFWQGFWDNFGDDIKFPDDV